MKEPFRKKHMGSIAPLLLFVIFTACILIVLLTGADVYQKFCKRDQTSFEHRTIAQYLTTRMRQSDSEAMPFVGDFYECLPESCGNTFFLCEEAGDRTFYTRIYYYDGYLRELFTAADGTFNPEDGEKILELNDLYFTFEDNLLQIEIAYADGTSGTLILNLRSGKEIFNES